MTDRMRKLPDFDVAKQESEMAELVRSLAALRPFAAEIAAHRREMYLVYLEVGFTEAQALDLAAKALP